MSKDKDNETPMVDGKKEFTLPSGKKAVIHEGKGVHASQAVKIMGDDSSKYLAALMSQLVEIDGKPIVMEDLDEMPLKDYMKIQGEFASQNF